MSENEIIHILMYFIETPGWLRTRIGKIRQCKQERTNFGSRQNAGPGPGPGPGPGSGSGCLFFPIFFLFQLLSLFSCTVVFE